MRIAVFGGSFDPPHRGHLTIIKEALKRLDIDLLIVVPTYRNPFKAGFFAPPKLRLRWLERLCRPIPRCKVCAYEIKQQRPTYTVETIAFIKRRFAPSKIYLLIGSDNLASLASWHNYKKLRKEVEFVVFTRRGYRSSKRFKTLSIDVPISSTELRANPRQRHLPRGIAREVIRFYRASARPKTPRSDTFGGRLRS